MFEKHTWLTWSGRFLSGCVDSTHECDCKTAEEANLKWELFKTSKSAKSASQAAMEAKQTQIALEDRSGPAAKRARHSREAHHGKHDKEEKEVHAMAEHDILLGVLTDFLDVVKDHVQALVKDDGQVKSTKVMLQNLQSFETCSLDRRHATSDSMEITNCLIGSLNDTVLRRTKGQLVRKGELAKTLHIATKDKLRNWKP